MWNTWMDKGRELAEKAKQAAEQIEGQLDASVGAPTPTASTHAGPGAVLGGAGAGAGAASAGMSPDPVGGPMLSPRTEEKNASAFDDDAFYSHDDEDDEKEERERQMRLARDRLEAERQKIRVQTPPSSAGIPRSFGRMESSASMEMQFEGDYTNNATTGSSPRSGDLFQAAGLSSPSSTTATQAAAAAAAVAPSSGGKLNSLKLVGLATSPNVSPLAVPTKPAATPLAGNASPKSSPATTPLKSLALATPKLATPPPNALAPSPAPAEESPADDGMDEMYDDEDGGGGGGGWDGDDVDVDIDDVELDDAGDGEAEPAPVVVVEEPKAAAQEPKPLTPVEPESELDPEPPAPVEPKSHVDPKPVPVVAAPAPALEPEPEPEPVPEPAPVVQDSIPSPAPAPAPAPEPEPEPEPEPGPPVVMAPAPSPLPAVVSTPPPPAAPAAPLNPGVDESEILRLKEEHNVSLSTLQSQHSASLAALRSQLVEAREALQLREAQLASKSEQLASMQEIHEAEREELRAKVRETKDEAKKRILRAKERCEEMQNKLEGANAQIAAAGMDSGGKDEIIAQLRSEGEKLAMKQSQMEQRVREARGEARELADALEGETRARTEAEAKCSDLEAQLKRTRDELGDARKGETRAGKLDAELSGAREESERKSNQILGLEGQVKELKASNKEIRLEMEDLRKNSAAENERTSAELRRERDDLMSDLESKLRTSEREAAVREDALRHEVGELRKRWQDAVRRADELSMDAQQSSAPLMRQLESTERQNRARAAAWAELEMKLRSDLEDRVMEVEKLTKERNELRATVRRLERMGDERGEELKGAEATVCRLTSHTETLEGRVAELEDEGRKIKEEWVEVERRADEGVTKVRTEMMQTVLDSEERYRAQITNLERALGEERGRRTEMEGRLADLAETSGMMIAQQTQSGESTGGPTPASRPKKLKSATDQADILQGAMAGLVGDDDDESDVETEGEFEAGTAEGEVGSGAAVGSFAAMEQLSQGLRGARIELDALRGQLASSEDTREGLLAELAGTRAAAEKLPLFETRVLELTREVEEKDLEIMALREDIVEVRMMYRGQLDALLEEKAMNTPVQSDRKAPNPAEDGAAMSNDPSDSDPGNS